MRRETLILKSRINKPVLATNPATTVVAGKETNRNKNCTPVIAQLTEFVRTRSKVFIQMRHGAGYCGLPAQIEGYWLNMTDVSIHGTKQQAHAQRILIQIHDGIAHLHDVDEVIDPVTSISQFQNKEES